MLEEIIRCAASFLVAGPPRLASPHSSPLAARPPSFLALAFLSRSTLAMELGAMKLALDMEETLDSEVALDSEMTLWDSVEMALDSVKVDLDSVEVALD
ncbi:hypothetical protein OsJ_26635 [Oryza sativa Japonica Group]|uniref:Uncharacterized protein n=1 Tax=Oryza sativa subsp. japonica TaxID=39947 RepID=B9FZX3_ORYSJ|nr:hypothetical protein OsJ_26635 [Oryza sativa Japonica Group]